MAWPSLGNLVQSWRDYRRGWSERGLAPTLSRIADGSMTTPVGKINGSPLAVPRPNTPPYASPYDNAFFRFPQAGPQYSGGSPEEHAVVRYPRAGVPQNPAFAPATQSAGAAQPQTMDTGGGGQPASSPYAVNATLDESGRPVYPAARSLVTPYNDTPVPSPLRAGLATIPGSLMDALQTYERMALATRPGYTSEADLERAQQTPEERVQQIRMDAYVQPGESAAMDAKIAQMRSDWDAKEEAFGKAADSPLGSHGTAFNPQYLNQALQSNQGYVTAAGNTDAWRKPEDRLYPYLGSDGSVQYMEPLEDYTVSPTMNWKQRQALDPGRYSGPMVGTFGTGHLPTQEEREAAEWARKTAEIKSQASPLQEQLRERAVARAQGDPGDMVRYDPLNNPEGRIVWSGRYRSDGSDVLIDRKTGAPVYSSTKEKDEAKKQQIEHQAASKDRRRQKHNAARAAGYARSHGMPMGTAQGTIGAMDRQLAGSPLSSDDLALLGMPDIERQIAEQRYLADRQNVAAVLGHYLGNESTTGLTPEQVMQILQGAGFASPLGPAVPSGAAAPSGKPGLLLSPPEPVGMSDDVLDKMRKRAAAGDKRAAEIVAAEDERRAEEERRANIARPVAPPYRTPPTPMAAPIAGM